ncbi:hypothetical protein L9F63_023308, partial [Diploptera punctata]
MRNTMLAPVVLLLSFQLISCYESYQPEHVHIAYGENPYEIVVTWSTKNATKESVVEYGIGGFALDASGNSTLLIANTFITVEVKWDGRVYSGSQHHQKISTLGALSLQFLVIWGVKMLSHYHVYRRKFNEECTMPFLHVGDFAYDMDTDNGQIGDDFMTQIQPIASYLPYMTCPGNHEEAS